MRTKTTSQRARDHGEGTRKILSLHARPGINTMTFHEQVLGPEAAADERAAASLSSSIKSLTDRIVRWMEACANRRADAALYRSLRSLPDAELDRRGLSGDRQAALSNER